MFFFTLRNFCLDFLLFGQASVPDGERNTSSDTAIVALLIVAIVVLLFFYKIGSWLNNGTKDYELKPNDFGGYSIQEDPIATAKKGCGCLVFALAALAYLISLIQ